MGESVDGITTEQAAAELAEVIHALSVEGVLERLEALARSAGEAQHALAGDFDALDAAANALLKVMEEQSGRLAQETKAAVEAVGEALDCVEADAAAMKTAVDQAAEALAALDSAAGLLTVNLTEQLVSRADDPAGTLASQVDEAYGPLDQTLVMLLQGIRDVSARELGGARKEAVEAFGKRAQTAALKDAQRLALFFEEWVGRIAGAADGLKNTTLAAAAAHPAPAMAAMMEACATEHREVFDQVLPVVDSVSALLAELQGDLVRVDGLVADQLAELIPMTEDLDVALDTAATELQKSGAFLAAALRAQ